MLAASKCGGCFTEWREMNVDFNYCQLHATIQLTPVPGSRPGLATEKMLRHFDLNRAIRLPGARHRVHLTLSKLHDLPRAGARFLFLLSSSTADRSERNSRRLQFATSSQQPHVEFQRRVPSFLAVGKCDRCEAEHPGRPDATLV